MLEVLFGSEGSHELETLIVVVDSLDVGENRENIETFVLSENESFLVDEPHFVGLNVVLDVLVVAFGVKRRHQNFNVSVDQLRFIVAKNARATKVHSGDDS